MSINAEENISAVKVDQESGTERDKTPEGIVRRTVGILLKNFAISERLIQLRGANTNILASEAWHIQYLAGLAGNPINEQDATLLARKNIDKNRFEGDRQYEYILKQHKSLSEEYAEVMLEAVQNGISPEQITYLQNEIRQGLSEKASLQYRETVANRVRTLLNSKLTENDLQSKEFAYQYNKLNDETNNLAAICRDVYGMSNEQIAALKTKALAAIKENILNQYTDACLSEGALHSDRSNIPETLKGANTLAIENIQSLRLKLGDFLVDEFGIELSGIKLIRDRILNPSQLENSQPEDNSPLLKKIFSRLRRIFTIKSLASNPSN